MRDKQSSGSSEIAALAERVANARGRLPLQDDAALVQVLSDAEIDAERELAQWVRAQRRGQRKRAVQDELTAEKRDRRTTTAIQRADDADARWHRRALAARRRVSNQDARLAQLYRRAEWSSRALIAVVVLGMVWAGVNVQHNLVPSGNMSDPLYWLSYGIEAMISIPIITIMVAATTAARWGRELDRGKVVFFETALLGTTIALNAGPHLAAGSFGQAAEYAIAPVMVGVVIWLHAWVSARYALLIDGVPLVDDEPDLPTRHRVTTERGAPITTFRPDEPTDRRELLAAKGFDPLLDQAGVRFPVDMTDPHAQHIAEAAMRGTQPEPVPLSRLDCTETLVYHAQSTRSTNGRLTQQIPTVDEYRQADTATAHPSSDSIHEGTRAGTTPAAQPISNHAAPTSSATNPVPADAAYAAHTEIATPNVPIGLNASGAGDITAPSATINGASQAEAALVDQGQTSTHTPAYTAGDSPADNRASRDEFATTGDISTHSAPPNAPHITTDVAADNPQPTHNPATATSTLGENLIHASAPATRLASGTNPTDEPAAHAAASVRPSLPAHDQPTATTAEPIAAPATATPTGDQHTTAAATSAEPRIAANNRVHAAAIGEPRTAPVTTHTEQATPMSTREERTTQVSGIEPHTAQTTAANTRTEHTTPTATAANTRHEHTTPASGVTHRTAQPTVASTRDERTTSGAAHIDSHRGTAGLPSADSQLSIFDTTTVEPAARTPHADTAENRTLEDITRGEDPRTRTEPQAHPDAPAETRRTTLGSAAPSPAEHIARTVANADQRPQNDSTTDHKDSQRLAEEREVEVRQLDRAQRRTTSEVISEVVQSLSADDLLAENLGSEGDDIEVWSVARAIAGRGLSVIPVEQLAEILMLADQSWTPTSIGAEVGLSRTAIAQVLEFARRVRRPYAISS
ncbi:hypothetical protein ACQP1G_42000 [Nocardia sp. CA-107356]|uniref:hypothetical protein n=1 Tax=Nocardia sp. CA-107356 TaxID=3239972 RepID=UPI003D8D9292